jgi:hypothetical protein
MYHNVPTTFALQWCHLLTAQFNDAPLAVFLVVLRRDCRLGELLEYNSDPGIHRKIFSGRNIQSYSWNREYNSNTDQLDVAELDSRPFMDRAAVTLFVTAELFFVSSDRLELLLPGVSAQIVFLMLLRKPRLTSYSLAFVAADREVKHRTGYTSTAA